MPPASLAAAVAYFVAHDEGDAGRAEVRLKRWATEERTELVRCCHDVLAASGGFLLARPGFIEALSWVRRAAATRLVLLSPDQLGEGQLPSVLAEVLADRLGARLVFLDGSRLEDTAQVCVRVETLRAELHRLVALDRQLPITTGLAGRGDEGKRRSRYPPYGQRLSDDGVSLVAEPGEEEVIAVVSFLRDQGLSYRAICDHLTEAGYRPRGAARWHAATVRTLALRAKGDC